MDITESFAEQGVKSLGLDKSEKEASKYFTDLLKKGRWDFKQEKRKFEILVYEYLINKARKSIPQKRYLGGSFVEGSEMEGSDHDNMFIYPNVRVTTKTDFSYDSKDTVFFLMKEGLRACYVQLCYIPGHGVIQFDNQLNPLKYLEKKEDELNYLLSSKYAKDQFTHIKETIILSEEKTFSKNGPCASLESHELMADYVFTLECDEWPPVAVEWTNRERRYGWPDEKLRNAVINTKCSLVPIGNPASEENVRKFEWRISFLLGERQLMWSLNQSQYFCFILLKKLKKRFIDPNHKDVISSFILKTTLFWELEETDASTWSNDTIIENVKSCLTRLSGYVEKKTIWHYFAMKNNLFTGKFVVKKDHEELIKTIKSIQEKVLAYLYMDSTEFVPGKNHRVIDCKWSKDKVLNRNYFYCNIENALHLCTLGDLDCFECYLNDQKGKGSKEVQELHSQAEKLLSLKFASVLYTKYDKDQAREKEIVTKTLREIEEKYKKAKDVDAICGRLHLASFYFKQQRFDEVREEITSIYQKELCLYDGGSSNVRVLKFKDKEEIDGEKSLDIAHDISFCSSDMCVPDVIKSIFQGRKQSIIRIHPLVYLHLLEFLVSSSTDQRRTAFEKLQNEVSKSKGGHDIDIAAFIVEYSRFCLI